MTPAGCIKHAIETKSLISLTDVCFLAHELGVGALDRSAKETKMKLSLEIGLLVAATVEQCT